MNVCIVGTGYVGLVTAACLAETGNNVYCVDINQDVVDALAQGRIHIYEPGLEELVRRNYAEGRLQFTTSLEEGLAETLFVFICVGTPPRADGRCDLSYVNQVATDIGRKMTEYIIVVNKSTVPVGTADDVRRIIREQLEARGEDIEYDVVSNPEFLKEGDAIKDFMKPDRIVVGADNVRTAELLKALYSPFARSREKMIVMNVRSAEMTKYAANCMLAAKISFINEIANICEKVGADVREVRFGIGADHRIGYHFIYPGVGYGGSCFPKDVNALISTALDNDYQPTLLQAVHEVNQRQKLVLARKIENYFKDKGGMEGRTLALWGLSFKPNTDDTRDAPSYELIRYVTERGMKVKAFDPIAGERARAELADNPLVEIEREQYRALEGTHGLAVVTDWNQFRTPQFPKIKKLLLEPVIFDGRNLYNPMLISELGFVYFSIGRRPIQKD
ncbi:MAG: UDP-glucose/GDP-mannose dehydrogenase family protein [Pseudomonadota bacterium]